MGRIAHSQDLNARAGALFEESLTLLRGLSARLDSAVLLPSLLFVLRALGALREEEGQQGEALKLYEEWLSCKHDLMEQEGCSPSDVFGMASCHWHLSHMVKDPADRHRHLVSARELLEGLRLNHTSSAETEELLGKVQQLISSLTS